VGLTPRPYQIEGRDFLAGRTRALLADEMRVGKSCQAIMAAHKLGAQSMLVTCPAIAVPHWHREIEKWWPSGPLPKAQVLSYNKATTLWEEGFSQPRFDVFIPDEAHFAKTPTAKRTRMVYGKTGFGQAAGAIWPLSGTPAPKHAAELWPMLKAFGVVGMDYQAFIERYCVYDKWADKIRGTKQSMIPELRTLLATVMLRRTRKDVAPDMPAIDFQFLEITPTTAADLPAGIDTEHLEDNPTSMQAERIAVAQSKVVPLAKNIDFAISNELLKQTVVFGWHTEPLEHLTRLLNSLNINTELITGKTTPVQREKIQNNFRSGLTQVIVGNIMSCGTAIDLSSASHGHFIELDWVSGNNVQAANRLVSMEKKEKVTIDVATVPGTIDDGVQQVLMRRVRELSQLY
jgi:SWI/SNF-related matrix-associated actin-dependent regulator 1 of chromatin subfamily A